MILRNGANFVSLAFCLCELYRNGLGLEPPWGLGVCSCKLGASECFCETQPILAFCETERICGLVCMILLVAGWGWTRLPLADFRFSIMSRAGCWRCAVSPLIAAQEC